jgi:membrane-bound ClpP family serine protease
MTPVHLALIFAAIGLLLIIADLFLPSHGLLSVGGIVSLIAAVVCCFLVSARLGAVVGASLIIASPFVVMLLLRIWPHTFVGKRMTLAAVATTATSPAPHAETPIRPGDRGIAITELRPVGVCDFAGQRVESLSDQGILPHGSPIYVVSIQNKRPIVRPVTQD